MALYKMSAMVLSAALLGACSPPTYYGSLDNERHVERVLCKNVAPLGSNIRRKTCRVDRQLTFDERKRVLRTMEQRPISGGMPSSSTR